MCSSRLLENIYRDIFGELKQSSFPVERTGVKININKKTNPKVDVIENDLPTILSRRRCTRTVSQEPIIVSQLGYLLETSLGVTKKENNNIYYSVPKAGNQRELVYIIVINNVSGILPGTLYEYVPEELTLYELNIQNGSFFYEKWESNAAFNIIFCMFRECRRNYLNNVFLTSFEVGCCCQNLQLVTSSLGFGSCISGIININEFYSYFKELVPLQSISIFKVKNDN